MKTKRVVCWWSALYLSACADNTPLPADSGATALYEAGVQTQATDTERGHDAALASDASSDLDAGANRDAGLADGAALGRDPGLDAGGQHDAGHVADGAANTASDAGPSATHDAGPSACPPVEARAVVDIGAGVLAADRTHWTCDNIYVLNGIVFVHAADPATPAVLTIDPGTLVRGQTTSEARGFLVVTRNGRIEAQGTKRDPIVFTSANPKGQRARGDWGGITLLGAASTGGTRRTEGFPATVAGAAIDGYLAYGPRANGAVSTSDAGVSAADAGTNLADDAHNCGTLRYVRIEFASYDAGGSGNESNAIQLYACGYGTNIDFLHSHLSGDDGIEIFGGTVDLRHLLITGASDDSVDWDDGYRGRMQFIAAQQYPDAADLGFEAGGSSDTPAVAPDPRIFNVSLVGTNGGAAGNGGGRLRGASLGYLRNFIFLGFNGGALDIGGSAAAQNLVQGSLSVNNSVFWRASTASHFPTGAADVADDLDPSPNVTVELDEAIELTKDFRHNQVIDPQLTAPFNLTRPDFTPRPGAPLAASVAEAASERSGDTRPAFFDVHSAHIGAFAPGGSDWTDDWTDFPMN